MTPIEIGEVAEQIYQLEKTAASADPITDRFVAMSVEEAYAVQTQYVASRIVRDGVRRIGVKVGCTSLAIQQAFGIDQPDFGVLLEDMQILESGRFSVAALVQPRVEAELAFRLSRPLRGPVEIDEVLAATESIAPSLEIIDSRINNWAIQLADTIADNGSSARFILGEEVDPGMAGNLRDVTVTFQRNDNVPIMATGRAVLGHPARAVAWLSARLATLGETLRAGDVVLSGSFTPALPCVPGDHFVATFDPIGTVTVDAQ